MAGAGKAVRAGDGECGGVGLGNRRRRVAPSPARRMRAAEGGRRVVVYAEWRIRHGYRAEN